MVGGVRTGRAGSWSPTGIAFTVQWYRSGVAIKGATKSTYRLTTSDYNKLIQVRIVGSKKYYKARGALSAPTASIGLPTGGLTARS